MKMARTVDGCGAGVSPAVAGASRSRARAEPVLSGAKECPRDSGRDARTTVFKAVLISSNRGDGKPSPYEITRVCFYFFFLGWFKTTRLSVTEKTLGTWLARMRMIVSSSWLSTTPSSVTWPLSTMIWMDGKA